MKRTMRAFALGLLMGTALVSTSPQFGAGPALAQSQELAPSQDRSIGWYQEMVAKMDRRTLRRHVEFLKSSRTSANRKEIRAKLDIVKAELRRQKGTPSSNQAGQADQPGSTNTGSDTQVSRVESTARRFLSDARPAGELSKPQLRERVSKVGQMLEWKDISNRTRNRLERLLERDKTALGTSSGSQPTQQTQVDDPANDQERTAEGILSDRRSAGDLNEEDLRKRVERNRTLLREGRLGKRYNQRMRERLRADRQELRRRLRDQRAGSDADRNTDWVAFDRRLASGDVRHARDLRNREISNRISRTRNLLDRRDLTSRERTRLLALLEDDRRELRQRFRKRRDNRRGELSKWLRNNEINIVIAPPSAYAPRNDIAFAEVNDELIERQLIAPPRRRIERRYTFEEYRGRRELREYMPAIDVDSIHFGFDEAFIRAEEIDELERLGAVIERIVAKNPNEVFLIEGHTDAVGDAGYNMDLSQRRAVAIRSALLEYFVIEPQNLETIGYGEEYLKIPTEEEEQENRRVTVRRITPMLSQR